MLNILFVASEVHPLIKTGGLADVAGALPTALKKLKQDVRILLPAYSSVLQKIGSDNLVKLKTLDIDGESITLWQSDLPGTRVKVILVDIGSFSQREGNPYVTPEGNDWPDNAQRFYHFCQAGELIALNNAGLKWQPDLVHCNDWQTGPLVALLSRHAQRPASIFTIHNLAYRGLFSWQTFRDLKMPDDWWHHQSMEFYGQLAFIKGGLVYADTVTTVSPSYAEEIQTSEYGWGLEGLLRYRRDHLHGILNGIDTDEWHPGRDPHLPHHYHARTLGNKLKNKLALQQELGLSQDKDKPLLGFIGRLVDQKGVDLILGALSGLLAGDSCQFVMLGSGMNHYQSAFEQLAKVFPGQAATVIGYNEALAHRIESGIDAFLMPSAFEPCGLNQLYSLRYGTPPLVHSVGGLKDSVIPWSADNNQANGFAFENYTTQSLLNSINQLLKVYADKKAWQQLQRNAMAADFSWKKSAQAYLDIYQGLCARHTR